MSDLLNFSDLTFFSHERQRFIMKDTRPPANAFEWMRYTEEERERRGEKHNENNTSRKRSVASTKAVERLREGNPTYGTLGVSSKTAAMVAMKPKNFTVYSKARKAA